MHKTELNAKLDFQVPPALSYMPGRVPAKTERSSTLEQSRHP